MIFKPSFPTSLHQDTAELVRDYFFKIKQIDTVLVVNSCARGQSVPESDLDFAILVNPETKFRDIHIIEKKWQIYSASEPTIIKYKQSNQFAHLHLDIIDGRYTPEIIVIGEPQDFFELEIGNQICYSAPMDSFGQYFQELQIKWLPYFNEELRLQRLTETINACEYNLNHISLYINRCLYFQAFDVLCKAFREYLQALFLANRIYPIAYNKWIKEQVVNWLKKPDLYPKLSPILSISNIESKEIFYKAELLRELLNELKS
jgi:predicted nucleotidyltransferase